MDTYDIAIIGAGPAGIMAAVSAAQLKKSVILIEGNDCIGKKMRITGKGRCNITNTASLDTFIEKFGKQGQFLRSAFSAFSNTALIDFFQSRNLSLKVERQGRVFPASDNADSIITFLQERLKEHNIKPLYNARVAGIKKEEALFKINITNKDDINAKKIILATGGASYKTTGSKGDGFQMAKRLGHSILPLQPALVPLKSKTAWIKDLQGLALKNVRLTFKYPKKKITSSIGEIIFTHFGISGPLVLDLSSCIIPLLKKHKKIDLFIDLKPGLDLDKLNNKLLGEFKFRGGVSLKNIMKAFMPNRLIDVFLDLLRINPEKSAGQVTKYERIEMANLLKALPLDITGSLDIEYAMVTNGGVSTKEINPKTMESKLLPGLYFAGEIIDGCAPSGGYNLQQAFSTGYLAGTNAAKFSLI